MRNIEQAKQDCDAFRECLEKFGVKNSEDFYDLSDNPSKEQTVKVKVNALNSIKSDNALSCIDDVIQTQIWQLHISLFIQMKFVSFTFVSPKLPLPSIKTQRPKVKE